MRSFIRLSCALMVLLATLATAPGARADTPDPNEQKLIQQAKKDGKVRVLVRFTDASQRKAVTSKLAARKSSVTVKAQFKRVPLIAIETDADTLDELARNPAVKHLQLDAENKPDLGSTIPLIGADEVQRRGITGRGQNVAIVDSGIDVDHPFYAGRIVRQACFSDPANFEDEETLCPNGDNDQTGDGAADAETGQCQNGNTNLCDHGTHVAGISAGSTANDSSAPGNGVAPEAGIVAIQAFHRDNDEGDCDPDPAPCVRSYTSDQILALEHVLELRDSIDIAAVNMSIGSDENNEEHCDGDERKDYIDQLLDRGTATVISAGNEGHNHGVGTPGCISSAITVGSSTDADGLADYTNRGPLLDLFAPGSAVDSSVPDDTYGSKDGTSMAAPHVTGAFAVLAQERPNASVGELLQLLRDTGEPITYESGGDQVTTPRIALDRALPRDATVVDYTGPTSGSLNEAFTATARLTVDGQPRADLDLQFQLGRGGGSQACTGRTDDSGVARCELTPTDGAGEVPLVVTFRGTDELAPASDRVTFTIGRQATVTEYTGPVEADFHDAFTPSARLTAGGEPVSGQPISFVLGEGGGSQACTGTTNGSGVASCSMTPTQTPGRTTIRASFGGTDELLPSSDSVGFTVRRQQTAVDYTGPRKVANGVPAKLSAVLTEETTDGPPVSGREVTIALGEGEDRQACTGTTNGSGVVNCTIPLLDQPLNADATVPVTVDFGGDAFYLLSQDKDTVLLEYYTGRSYGLSADLDLPLLELGIDPTPDTGQVRTAHASSTETPCVADVSVLILSAHALCPDVTTSLAPGTSKATAKVDHVSIGLPGLPVVEVDGVSARSTSTCGNGGSASGTTDLTLRVGGELVEVTAEPNAVVELPGAAKLVVNEQLPVPGADHGLTVNAVHLIAGDGLSDVVVASATSDVHNCAS